MRFVDSHCHLDRLDLDPYHGDIDSALNVSRAEGVNTFLCVGINRKNLTDVVSLAEQHADIYATVGVHPNSEDDDSEIDVKELVQLAAHPKVVAIGETGLDYFRSKGDLEWQKNRFRTHIHAAKESQLPLVIHCREAKEDTLKIMAEERAGETGGVMHCFVEDLATAEKAIEMGFYISFSGILTFNSAKELQEVARVIPDESILIETDSPYLAPVPYRGKPNYPHYVKQVAEKLAELRGTTLESVAQMTTNNFHRCFPAIVAEK